MNILDEINHKYQFQMRVISTIEDKVMCNGANGKLVHLEGNSRVILFDPSYFDPKEWDYSLGSGDKVNLVARNPPPVSECNYVCAQEINPPVCLEGIEISRVSQ